MDIHSENFPFEVLISDKPIVELISDCCGNKENEKLLSIVNQYEDKQWNKKLFIKKILDYAVYTALNEEERAKCIGQSMTQAISVSQKMRLRVMKYDEKEEERIEAGELGEIFLYGIMRYFFNAEICVPKIFNKQNSNLNAFGADSAHIVLNYKDEKFSIWLGESKFYTSIKDGIKSAVDSVISTLKREHIHKENSIISGLSELEKVINDTQLYNEIKKTLSNVYSIDLYKEKLHIPILIIYENETLNSIDFLSDEIKTNIKNEHINYALNYFQQQHSTCSELNIDVSKIQFHFIVFPVHDKEDIIKDVSEKIKTLRSWS